VYLFDPNSTAAPFYVVNSSLSAYKCIGNGGGQVSTIQPTGTSAIIVTLGDGYQWKYMFTINTGDVLAFVTTNYIPVRTLLLDDGSNQWQVQQAAIPGTIDRIDLVASGSQYTMVPNVVIQGDGAGASAIAIIGNGNVLSIAMTSNGSNYSWATATITGGGTDANGATVNVIISPRLGHGADPITELGAFTAMISSSLKYDEGGAFTTSNDYRRIGIIENPILSSTGTPAFALDYSSAISLTLSGFSGSTFLADELIVGATSGYSAYCLDWNSLTGVIRLVQATGLFVPGEYIVGSVASGIFQTYSGNAVSGTISAMVLPSNASAVDGAYTGQIVQILTGTGAGQIITITGYIAATNTILIGTTFSPVPDSTSLVIVYGVQLPAFAFNQGTVMYLENRQPIMRSVDQTESIRMLIAH
jgi:hypothetical protein